MSSCVRSVSVRSAVGQFVRKAGGRVQRQGVGVHHSLDGSVFSGAWSGDKMNGQGECIHSNGIKYKVIFALCICVVAVGVGVGVGVGVQYVLVWAGPVWCGVVCAFMDVLCLPQGDFVDGCYHGNGTMTWPSGCSYAGGFSANR